MVDEQVTSGLLGERDVSVALVLFTEDFMLWVEFFAAFLNSSSVSMHVDVDEEEGRVVRLTASIKFSSRIGLP